MYFVRVDYIYRHSAVQRSRNLCKSMKDVLGVLRSLRRDGVIVLQVKIELCC